MDRLNIRNTMEIGMWFGPHFSLRSAAHTYYSRYIALLEETRQRTVDLLEVHKDVEEEYREDVVYHELREEYAELERLEAAGFINAVFTVEAFINFYGVKKLGEDYYKRNIERLNLESKVSLIIALCFQVEVAPDDEIYRIVKYMREDRNHFAHPKTKEFNPRNKDHLEQVAERNLEIDNIGKYIKDMERIHEIFCELDTDLKSWVFDLYKQA